MKYYKGKSLNIGGGGRFLRLEDALRAKGIDNPSALAANIGRRKLGVKKFQGLAKRGLRRFRRSK